MEYQAIKLAIMALEKTLLENHLSDECRKELQAAKDSLVKASRFF
jgi:hypothetical protein